MKEIIEWDGQEAGDPEVQLPACVGEAVKAGHASNLNQIKALVSALEGTYAASVADVYRAARAEVTEELKAYSREELLRAQDERLRAQEFFTRNVRREEQRQVTARELANQMPVPPSLECLGDIPQVVEDFFVKYEAFRKTHINRLARGS
jgi:hypothetical protein